MNPSCQARDVEVDTSRPLFICGVGRSGTSLLQSMLNAHPDVCFPPETHFFRRYVAGAESRRWELVGRETLVAQLRSDQDFARAGIEAESLFDSHGGPLDLVEAYRRVLRSSALARGKTRVGDKDPRHLDFLPELAEAFPGALVLHVVRDPRDVLLSRTLASWSARRPWWTHPLVYHEQVRRGRQQGHLLFGDNYVEICYEELIAEPESVLYRICNHADLAWDATMLEFSASATQLVDPSEMSWKKETLGPLLRGNAGKWKSGLTPLQIAFTEGVCGQAFKELGYQRSQQAPGLFDGLAPILHMATSLAYDLRLGRRRGA